METKGVSEGGASMEEINETLSERGEGDDERNMKLIELKECRSVKLFEGKPLEVPPAPRVTVV